MGLPETQAPQPERMLTPEEFKEMCAYFACLIQTAAEEKKYNWNQLLSWMLTMTSGQLGHSNLDEAKVKECLAFFEQEVWALRTERDEKLALQPITPFVPLLEEKDVSA